MIEPMSFFIIVACGLAATYLKPTYQTNTLRRWIHFGKLAFWGGLFAVLVPPSVPASAVFSAVVGYSLIDLGGDWLAHLVICHRVRGEPVSRSALEAIRREIG